MVEPNTGSGSAVHSQSVIEQRRDGKRRVAEKPAEQKKGKLSTW